MRDYKSTELPKYVKNPNYQYNKPEHYDYTPDEIPQWHLEPDLAIKFKQLKDKWEKDPNRKFRENVKAYDSKSIPNMEGGLDMIYPDTNVRNLFEMRREHNLPNSIIINALEEGGYDGKYIHNTEHLRRFDSCKLNALQHNNQTNLYYDPNIRYMHLDKFPKPNFNIEVCNNNNINQFKDQIIPTDNLNLDTLSNYQASIYSQALDNTEYSYKSDEINTQYLNRSSGMKTNNSKVKNINQYCTNYPPPNYEQLRKVNDNTAHCIYSGK